MQRLKILLKYNTLYYILIGLALSFSLIYAYLIKYQSKYDADDKEIIGVITKINIEANKYKLEIKSKEKVIGYYYAKDNLNLELGMKIKVVGLLYLPSNNTIPNTFNYRKYLYNHHIYYLMKIDKIIILNKNNSFIWTIKNYLNQKFDNYQETSPYLKALILGDLKNLDDDIYQNYQKNGVIHLFAISGMHLNLLSAFLFFILKKTRIKEVFKYIIIILFLIMFCLIINTTYSVYRSLIFFILLAINKIYDFGISTKNILFLTVFILIIINPLIIHDLGFQYSVITTYGLIISLKKQKSYFKNLLYSSFIAFLFSLPITLINFYEINLLTPINNLILGPFITFIIYPLAILTSVFHFFEPIFYLNLILLEFINNILSNISYLNLIIPKVSLFFFFIYYLLIIMYVYSYQKKYLCIAIFLLISFKLSLLFNNNFHIYFLDVGQGDSTLIYNRKESILIDTGGLPNYQISNQTVIFLKSLGITKLNYLILTHGDYDHMGDAINIVNNFKVEKIIFNCGTYNDLEKELIKILDKKNIEYYLCIKELNMDKYKLQFLNTKEYNNENDNSNVIYFNYKDIKFLFMGDAGIQKEKGILKKYYLTNIDFLKVGHHGSNTGNSEYFVNSISPKYSLISVGKNNRYGHPKDSVLDILKDSKVYRTDLDGSIEIRLNKNGYKIGTCNP